MSYCQLIVFRDGKPTETVEFGNAWGGAARIWTALYAKYLKATATSPYATWMTDADRLWPLAKRSDLPEFERAVLAATFDMAVVKQDDFRRFAEHLLEFDVTYQTQGVSHLEAWARIIEACDGDHVGFYMMSVSANPWSIPAEGDDGEEAWYDLKTGDRHFDVYEPMEE